VKRIGRLAILALMIAALLAPGLAGTAAAQDAASLCIEADAAGAGAVVAGYDVVSPTGGSGSQIVLGYGSSTLSGGSGNDILCSWGGGNTLDGGSGNDTLIVISGADNALHGGSGNDAMIGYASDYFDGGSGNNTRTDLAVMDLWTVDSGLGYNYTVKGTGFTAGGKVNLKLQFFDSANNPLSGVFEQTYNVDSQGNFQTFGYYSGCDYNGNEIAYTTGIATDNTTGDVYSETFTRAETCLV